MRLCRLACALGVVAAGLCSATEAWAWTPCFIFVHGSTPNKYGNPLDERNEWSVHLGSPTNNDWLLWNWFNLLLDPNDDFIAPATVSNNYFVVDYDASGQQAWWQAAPTVANQ